MRYVVEFDTNDAEGEYELEATDVVLLGVEPTIENGSRATYNFPDGTSEDDITEALELVSWCYFSMSADPENAIDTPDM